MKRLIACAFTVLPTRVLDSSLLRTMRTIDNTASYRPPDLSGVIAVYQCCHYILQCVTISFIVSDTVVDVINCIVCSQFSVFHQTPFSCRLLNALAINNVLSFCQVPGYELSVAVKYSDHVKTVLAPSLYRAADLSHQKGVPPSRQPAVASSAVKPKDETVKLQIEPSNDNKPLVVDVLERWAKVLLSNTQ